MAGAGDINALSRGIEARNPADVFHQAGGGSLAAQTGGAGQQEIRLKQQHKAAQILTREPVTDAHLGGMPG